jgi:hypothetical protein
MQVIRLGNSMLQSDGSGGGEGRDRGHGKVERSSVPPLLITMSTQSLQHWH